MTPEPSVESLCATELFEELDAISRTEAAIASEEGIKELWHATKERVLIMLGNHDAMLRKLAKYDFSRLDPNAYVRAVLPKDLEAAMNALDTLNELLGRCREGETLKMEEFVGPDLNNAGIELKEDGLLYATKFKSGAWGAGKGKSNLNEPMTFKKTIEEAHWEQYAERIADAFVNAVKRITKSKMVTSIDNHYRDLARAVASKQEKADVKTEKRVSLNQVRNIIAIRNVVIKFVFKQLVAVGKAYVPPKEENNTPAE